MKTFKDDEAKKFLTEIHERNQRFREEQLAKAKETASASGKEPFSLEKLETLCDTSIDGFIPPEEFAALLARLSRY